MAEMSQSDKMKAGAAACLLVIAAFAIYWFGFRSTGASGDDLSKLQAAPVTETKDGPPPAANRRIPPGAK
ncbi:MAG: hypothetical protein NTV94_09775 [Planctomycetota bacterium]|nr:hypothetical protein [Planctomycetota bacterium]